MRRLKESLKKKIKDMKAAEGKSGKETKKITDKGKVSGKFGKTVAKVVAAHKKAAACKDKAAAPMKAMKAKKAPMKAMKAKTCKEKGKGKGKGIGKLKGDIARDEDPEPPEEAAHKKARTGDVAQKEGDGAKTPDID